jgi:ankyrin repeat protein
MPNDPDDFFDVVLFGEPAEIRERLQQDKSLAMATDKYGFTALHVLMTEDRPQVAQILIDAGADVNARNDQQMTPLHLAQHRSLVELLVKHGADLNSRAQGGVTPLHVAASEGADTGSIEVIEALLKARADATLRDDEGQTAKQIAAARDEHDKIALFEAFEKS